MNAKTQCGLRPQRKVETPKRRNAETGVLPAARVAAGLAAIAVAALLGGCASAAHLAWPEEPRQQPTAEGDTLLAYDMQGSGKPDYTQRLHAGRKTVLYFDDAHDGQMEEEVRIDRPDPAWPHYEIILDGVPYRLVAELWDQGHFRLFPRPSKVISTFPSMTDLALSRLMHTAPCLATEASYFDREANRVQGGTGTYNAGGNSPWLDAVTYSASDAMGARPYLDPAGLFAKELREMRVAFDQVKTGTASGYSVGSAGLGTRGGEAAIREYLLTLDRFCERLVYDRRGRVRITLTADHGHSLTRSARVSFKNQLAGAGFRQADNLRSPNDVVEIEYGLVTCAQFFTTQPAAVGGALVGHRAVDLVVYPEGDAIVVRNATDLARIGRRANGYTYAPEHGDPLRLLPIVDALRRAGKVNADGVIDDAALFAATVNHDYPDALQRIWTCFHGLMQKPPDVIASLREGYCHGYWLFEYGVGKVASTHGALDAINSTTFVMSTTGPLPEALRIEDVLPAIDKAQGNLPICVKAPADGAGAPPGGTAKP